MLPSSELFVRPMQAGDVEMVQEVLDCAFTSHIRGCLPSATVPSVLEDRGYVLRRTYPGSLALVALSGQEIVGCVFANALGSCGFFGPIAVRPSCQGQGTANRLLQEVDRYFEARCVAHVDLFTFTDSPKHHHLYSKLRGLYPGNIAYIMGRDLEPSQAAAAAGSEEGEGAAGGDAAEAEDAAAIAAAAGAAGALPDGWAAERWAGSGSASSSGQRQAVLALSGRLYPGLDPSPELDALARSISRGTPLLLWRPAASAGGRQQQQQQRELAAFGCLHMGRGSEAGSRRCLVKLAGAADAEALRVLLEVAHALAASRGCNKAEAGVNLSRRQAFGVLRALQYRHLRSGLSMASPPAHTFLGRAGAGSSPAAGEAAAADGEGGACSSGGSAPLTYNREDALLICDFR